MTCINKLQCSYRNNEVKTKISTNSTFYTEIPIIDSKLNLYFILGINNIDYLNKIYINQANLGLRRYLNTIKSTLINQTYAQNKNCFVDAPATINKKILIIPEIKDDEGNILIHSCVLFFTNDPDSHYNNVWYLTEICEKKP